jgi:hypothetical protein
METLKSQMVFLNQSHFFASAQPLDFIFPAAGLAFVWHFQNISAERDSAACILAPFLHYAGQSLLKISRPPV